MFWLQEKLILIKEMFKKCSTDQRFILKEIFFFKSMLYVNLVKERPFSPSKITWSMLSSWTRSRNFCKLGSTYFFFAIGEILSYFFSRNFINPYLKKNDLPIKIEQDSTFDPYFIWSDANSKHRHFNLLIKGFEWKFYILSGLCSVKFFDKMWDKRDFLKITNL